MLVIRFQRVGRRNDPAYRIVVTEKRSKPKSGGVEILGSYHPKTKQTAIKNDRVLYWLSKGAKLSSTVHNLMISNKVISGNKISTVKIKKSGEDKK
ncbi:MAG: 30S ribosomal protein S16 [bacterium]|nr:30S ribosomal protein S16 [bacterium]